MPQVSDHFVQQANFEQPVSVKQPVNSEQPSNFEKPPEGQLWSVPGTVKQAKSAPANDLWADDR
jgi:hypothetical protein